MSDLCALTAVEQAEAVRTREISPVDLVEAALARIEQVQPVCNPFAFVFPEEARAEAKRLQGQAPIGPLHGVPVAFKDFTPTKGHVTTRGSRAFADWVAPEDPVIVQRFKAAGAIIVGKTNTPEFATSSFTHPPMFGRTNNPWDPEYSPGGSSGGAGVAATTGCVALAEGTDMGGSVRIPAALCGCVGLKPSLGRIPMDILPTVYDDMSHFGPLTRTIDDAALFLKVAEGSSEADISSQRVPTPLPETFDTDLTGVRLALSEDLGFFVVDEEIRVNLAATVEALREAGAIVTPIDLPWTPRLVEIWYQWWGVYQAAAFGHLLADHRDVLNPDSVTLIEKGFAMDAVSFARIDQERTVMWHDMARVFEDHDALLCPTMALPAPRNDLDDGNFEGVVDADGRLHGLDMTSIFNMVGQCPALSVPSGVTSAGLPTGAQIITRRFDDPMALRIGKAIEERRPWRQWTLGDLQP